MINTIRRLGQSRIFYLTLALILSGTILFANPDDRKRRIILNLGFHSLNSEMVSESLTPSGNIIESPLPIIVPSFWATYSFDNNFELGGYLAYSGMGHKVPLVKNSDGMYVLIDSQGVIRMSSNRNNLLLNSNTVFYGLVAKYNFLPLLTGKNNLRFSSFANAAIGLVSARWRELEGVDWVKKWNGPFAEYGIGLGTGYYFTKRLGINISYSFGKYYNKSNSRFALGLALNV